jgi:hypothetical protein
MVKSHNRKDLNNVELPSIASKILVIFLQDMKMTSSSIKDWRRI